MKASLFITGIGTDVGKTIAAATLVNHLKADYWKPVQSGNLTATDSMFIQNACYCPANIHPEAYRLQLAASPHEAAAEEKISIQPELFRLPETSNHLIIEGSGGLLSPLGESFYNIDLISKLNIKTVLVTKDYLGTINHTLLSIRALKHQGCHLAAIVFNGSFNPYTYEAIMRELPENCESIPIPHLSDFSPQSFHEVSKNLKLDFINS